MALVSVWFLSVVIKRHWREKSEKSSHLQAPINSCCSVNIKDGWLLWNWSSFIEEETAGEQKNFGGWVSDENGIIKNILQPRFGNNNPEKSLLCKRSSTTLTQRWRRQCTDTDSPIESSAALWSPTPRSHTALRFGQIGVSGCALHSSSLFWDTVSSSTLRWKHEAVSQSGSGSDGVITLQLGPIRERERRRLHNRFYCWYSFMACQLIDQRCRELIGGKPVCFQTEMTSRWLRDCGRKLSVHFFYLSPEPVTERAWQLTRVLIWCDSVSHGKWWENSLKLMAGWRIE